MQISDLDFVLPEDRIAQSPAEPRDSSRLLVYDRLSGSISHATVRDIGSFLPAHTVLVANNSRVRNSRLRAKLGEKEIEILVLEKIDAHTYRCLIGGKKVPVGAILDLVDHTASVLRIEPNPSMTTFVLRFDGPLNPEEYFSAHGETPLPPYIHNSTAESERYQTVYSKETGSAAAPTAGLHFTPELIQSLSKAGHPWKEVTLHVGLGTFLPLRQEHLESNVLHSEYATIEPSTADFLNETRAKGYPILAVGTTSTRTLESHVADGSITSGTVNTDIFIYPGYRFQAVNALLTNFHLPKSSLIALVAAFLGNHPGLEELGSSEEEMLEKAHELYRVAIEENYRFYSFGDAMLIL